jgi:hypothetical protein
MKQFAQACLEAAIGIAIVLATAYGLGSIVAVFLLPIVWVFS